ncbi:hypothetical protein BDF22DRAFT_700334 [Syncephalis plumigaleata]|nr:hypothetical protein BDF22DRAFT_700334 [Syncephalis plumigaleata]
MSANLFIGRETKSTFSKEYVEKYKDNLFLSNIRWGGGNDLDLSFARVDWNGHDAFMKCDIASKEVKAFNVVKDYAVGQQNVMNPLHRFAFTKAGPVDINLADPKQMYVYTVLQLDSNKNVIGAKIIDLDRISVFKKEQGWQRINLNDQEYLSPNPSQRYNSCNDFKLTLTNFLLNFVFVSKVNPFTYGDVLPESDAIEYLNHFNTKLAEYGLKQNVPRLTSESFDAKAAIPAMLRLTRAIYTLWHDSFPCSSPMRVLEGQPPRIGTPSRPVSPTF